MDADLLDQVQSKCNDGRGVTAARAAVELLRRGDDLSAKHLLTVWDHDKMHQYPELHALLRLHWQCCTP